MIPEKSLNEANPANTQFAVSVLKRRQKSPLQHPPRGGVTLRLA